MQNNIALRIFVGLFSVFCSSLVSASDLQEQFLNPDTSCAGVFAPAREYVGAQCPHPMIEIGYRNKISYLGLYPEDATHLHLDTDLQKLIGLNFYWKWVRLGYAYALKNYNKGFNFDYSFTFGSFNLSAGVAHVRNFKLVNRCDYSDVLSGADDEVRLRAFRSTDWNVNLEYIVDHKRFSGLSAYDYSYHRPQLRSHGSPIIGLSYAYNSFLKRHGFDQSDDADAVMSVLPVDHSYMYTFNIGAGYAYNVSFSQGKYVLGMLCLPYFSTGYADYNVVGTDSEDFVKEVVRGVRAHARVNFTYNYPKGAVSLSGEYNGAYLPFDEYDYRRDIVVFRINHAFKMGEYGLKSCKMPLRGFMDKSQDVINKM